MPYSTERIKCNPRLRKLRGWRFEDVWIDGYPDWIPHLQAIEHKDGSVSLRYCYYKKRKGRKPIWVPMPSFLYEETIDRFRKEIKASKGKLPTIETLLKRFFEEK